MNYKALFRDKETLQGKHFKCLSNSGGGEITLTGKERYPVFFVLEGSLTLSCRGCEYKLPAGEMVIADRNWFTSGFCLPGTIVMEYQLPRALTARFNAFNTPVTPTVPITGRLETWIQQRLLQEQPARKLPEQDELVDMLVRYQSRRLKPLSEIMRFYIEEINWIQHKKQHLDNQTNRA